MVDKKQLEIIFAEEIQQNNLKNILVYSFIVMIA